MVKRYYTNNEVQKVLSSIEPEEGSRKWVYTESTDQFLMLEAGHEGRPRVVVAMSGQAIRDRAAELRNEEIAEGQKTKPYYLGGCY